MVFGTDPPRAGAEAVAEDASCSRGAAGSPFPIFDASMIWVLRVLSL